jgi:hypothetical protein
MADEPTAATPPALSLPYPIWVCVKNDGSENLFGGRLTGGGKFVAVFTQLELAAQFLANQKKEDLAEIRDIPDETKFIGFLSSLLNFGITHVLFDDTGIGESPKQIVKIETILRVLPVAGG